MSGKKKGSDVYHCRRSPVAMQKPADTGPGQPPLAIPEASQAAYAELVDRCRTVALDTLAMLADSDNDRAVAISVAMEAGCRLMLAVDVDTGDPMVRLVTVGHDQRIVQYAAIGLHPPSERRN